MDLLPLILEEFLKLVNGLLVAAEKAVEKTHQFKFIRSNRKLRLMWHKDLVCSISDGMREGKREEKDEKV